MHASFTCSADVQTRDRKQLHVCYVLLVNSSSSNYHFGNSLKRQEKVVTGRGEGYLAKVLNANFNTFLMEPKVLSPSKSFLHYKYDV